ncbi:MAG: hypothetical protein C0599_11040 [Salinivirgaceae bacterium]|nr:MAG: hypothetical protein C0599_11040 [Salinivirgaceae bacterium]
MTKTNNQNDKSSWATGGGLLLGLGAGFFFLQTSALLFVGCLIGGLGLGLILTAILSRIK